MQWTDVTLSLLPLGLGEADISAYDEVPVLLTAACSATATATSPASPSSLHAGAGNLSDVITALEQQRRQETTRNAVITELLASMPSPAPTQFAAPPPPAPAKVVHLSRASLAAGGAATQSDEVLARLHYLAANHLCEVQRSTILARALSATTASAAPRLHTCDERHSASAPPLEDPISGCMLSADGARTYFLCPVEEGRYMAVVQLPAAVWDRLGRGGARAGVLAQWLVHTALHCTSVPVSRAVMGDATVTSAHTPLHACLTQSPTEVQRRMQAQVQLLARVVASFASTAATAAAAAVVKTSASRLKQKKPQPQAPQRRAERDATLRRLCCEDVSALRTHPRLWRRMEELLHAATSATDAAALRGGMATVGLPAGETRYVAGASAVWFRGSPLYRCLGSRWVDAAYSPCAIAALLRSAAVSATLEEARDADANSSDGGGSSAPYATLQDASVRLATVCLRTNPPTTAVDGQGAAGARSSGYISAPLRLTAIPTPSSADSTSYPAPVMLLSLASSSGWTVALLLRAMRTPFLGAPLATIVTGVQQLVQEHLESTGFARLVGDTTAAMRTAWRRPVALVSPLTAQLQEAIRAVRVARRACPAMAGVRGHATTPMGDVLLYALTRGGTEAAAARAASPSACLGVRLRCRSRHRDVEASTTGPALSPRAPLTSDADSCDASTQQGRREGGGAAVEAVLQAAARYAQLASRVLRCGAGPCGRGGGGPPSCALLGVPPRHRTVHSVLATKQAVHLVQAVPHRSEVGAGLYVITYVVIELAAKMVPARAHEEYRALAAWMLARCL